MNTNKIHFSGSLLSGHNGQNWAKLEPGTPPGLPISMAVAQALGPPFAAFPGTFAGSWMRSETARLKLAFTYGMPAWSQAIA